MDWRWGIMRYYGPTILYHLFKSIYPATRIVVSNLKYEIDKSTLAKFDNNVKDLLDDIYSNFSIIIDKGELHKYFVRHIFRAIFEGPNSNFNSVI